MVGQERGVGQLEHAAERFALDRHGLDPIAPGAQDLGRALDGPEQGSGVDLGDREELELEGGHGGDVPASSTDRPEQLRIRVAVDPDEPAVGRDYLRRDDAVTGEPELAHHPAQTAPERIAEDADVG